MQSFLQEPALDYNAHLPAAGSSLATGISSAHRSLQDAFYFSRRAAHRLQLLASNSKHHSSRKLAAVESDLRRAVEHVPILAFSVLSKNESRGYEERKSKPARQTMNMNVLLTHLMNDVERDLEIVSRTGMY